MHGITNYIYIADIPIELTQKKIKHMYIKVKRPDGRVVVSVPCGMSQDRIMQFVLSKRAWILRKQEDCRKVSIRGTADDTQMITEENREMYRAELKAKIAVLLPLWEERTGLYCTEWRVKDMKTRWGSCNVRAKRIWLSLQLANKPTVCLEYVILHELCHLRVHNHGVEFEALLDEYMPDWRERKKLL